jgi:hypothetical protein
MLHTLVTKYRPEVADNVEHPKCDPSRAPHRKIAPSGVASDWSLVGDGLEHIVHGARGANLVRGDVSREDEEEDDAEEDNSVEEVGDEGSPHATDLTWKVREERRK